MEKKIKEWLKEGLSDEDYTRAIHNSERQGRQKNLEVIEEAFSNALLGMFLWNDTPEGDKYWNNLFKKAMDIEDKNLQND